MAALRQIGDIQVFAEIQRGTTTTVYKGLQSSKDRFVLLKVLRPEFSQDEKLFKRFQDEAKIVARIQHPNVVAIYEHGRSEEWSYFATEFVEGLNLNELIIQNKIPPDLAWFILFETAKLCSNQPKNSQKKGQFVKCEVQRDKPMKHTPK